jgi:hypothetical protein
MHDKLTISLYRERLERARAAAPARPFMRLACSAGSARDLSTRKGFSRTATGRWSSH